jgi:hypothetical protein
MNVSLIGTTAGDLALCTVGRPRDGGAQRTQPLPSDDADGLAIDILMPEHVRDPPSTQRAGEEEHG